MHSPCTAHRQETVLSKLKYLNKNRHLYTDNIHDVFAQFHPFPTILVSSDNNIPIDADPLSEESRLFLKMHF